MSSQPATVRCCLSPQLTLALNQLVVSIALAIVGAFGVISTFGSFSFLSFVVSWLLLLSAALLGCASVFQAQWIDSYFGFVRFPAGSGMLLIAAGALAIGLSNAGQAVGYVSVVLGCVSIVVHVWLRCKERDAAVNIPLATRWWPDKTAAPASGTPAPPAQWPPAPPAQWPPAPPAANSARSL